MAYVTESRAAGTTLGQRFANFRTAILDRMVRAKIYRTTTTELSKLTDRELADLGIARSSIRAIAKQAAYGA